MLTTLRHAVPENRLRLYDMRDIVEAIADKGSVLEIRTVLSLVDCPGIMVGPEVERTALVRHCTRLFNVGSGSSRWRGRRRNSRA